MSSPATRKIVILGAGFVGRLNRVQYRTRIDDTFPGKHVARALAQNPTNRIQLTSKNPELVFRELVQETSASNVGHTANPTRIRLPISPTSFLPPHVADITDKDSLVAAFDGASVIISLVGVLSGSPRQFEDIQWKGVQNVVSAVKHINSNSTSGNRIRKIIHHSAIGADASSPLPYFQTKALAEQELFTAFNDDGPSVTVIRPSLIFGEGDGFFKVS